MIMSEELAVAEGGAPLSQVERVVDTFIAPSKTFIDVRRSASWWLPYILIVLVSYALAFAVSQKVGWSQLAQNTLHENPKAEEKMATMTPQQLAMQEKGTEFVFKGLFYGSPVTTGILLAIFAVVLWGTINFGFGGSSTFGQVFCVISYAWLIASLKSVLAIIVLYAGKTGDSFTMDSMVGTDIGYYIDTPGALKTFLTSFDIFQIWTMVVMGIGLAIVARTKRSNGLIAVFGWWLLILLIKTGFAAI
jgi:hypothetical protein